MTIVSKKTIITKDYSENLISNVWMKDSEEESSTGRLDVASVFYSNSGKEDVLISVIENARKTICIASPVLEDITIVEALVQARETRGVRIYLLLEKVDHKNISPLVGKSFIKTGISFDGSFCIADPSHNVSACFINDSLENDWFEMKNVCIGLDAEQAAKMYRLFCRWFWNEAKREMKNSKEEKDAVASPYGEVPLTDRAFILPLCRQMLQQKINDQSVSVVRNLDGSSKVLKELEFKGKVLINAKGNKPDVLNDQETVELRGTFSQEILPLQVICVSEKEAFLIPSSAQTKSKEQVYLLRLNTKQSKEIMSYVRGAEKIYNLVYHSDISYNDCHGKDMFRIGEWDNSFQVESKMTSRNQTTQVTLDELEQASFNNYLEEKEMLACKVDYPIVLEPIKLPNNAQQHRLYQDWGKTMNDVAIKKKDLLEGLFNIKEQNKSLGIFSFMGSFITGKNTTIKDLEKRINEIKNPTSNNIAEVRKCFDVINNIIPEINQQLEDLGKESKKAKARKEFEDKRGRDKKELEILKKQIAPLERELSGKENRLKEIKENEVVLRKEAEDNFLYDYFEISYNSEGERLRGKTKWESSYQNWEWDLEQSSFSQIKAKLTGTWSGIKKGKIKCSNEEREHIKELNDKLNSLYQTIKNEKRDLDKAVNDLKKRIKQDSRKIEELDGLLKKEFKYEDGLSRQRGSIAKMRKGSDSSSNHNLSSKQISTLKPQTIPKKELPAVGQLYSSGNKDYLTIENWNEYDEAKVEAARLSVQVENICVPA